MRLAIEEARAAVERVADGDRALVNDAPAGHHPSGFDPSRVEKLIEAERMVLDMLDDAYRRNKLHYLHFSPAWDVTQTRIAAMSWVMAGILARRDSDGSGETDETRSGSAVGDSAGRETASPSHQVSETPSDTLGEKA